MSTTSRILIVAALIGGVGVAIAVKSRHASPPAAAGPQEREAEGESVREEAPTPTEPRPALPRLVDLGADKCIPCKAMAPILEELKKEYAGRIEVQFIDVWKNPDAGTEYGVQMIPTQIFFDASGKERFRHTGFFGKEDILAKWKELGVL